MGFVASTAAMPLRSICKNTETNYEWQLRNILNLLASGTPDFPCVQEVLALDAQQETD